LDDEVDMVVWHTELKDPKALVGGRGEPAADGREDTRGRRQRTVWLLRRVTWTGCAARCGGRTRCGTPGRRPGVRLRPAPARRPPQVRGAGSESCKVRAILIRQY